MPRRRRRILSNTCYEICFRARSTLPFVAYRVISFLLAAILARTQRDNKVELCHDIWNGSHCHIFVVAKDAEKCIKFVMELEKKITDTIKRLLGISYLNLWESRPTIAEICTLEDAIDRIAYFYANPAQDDLVDSIEKFPGYSSWKDFIDSENTLEAKTERTLPWIRLHSIPKVPSPVLTTTQDRGLIHLLKKRNKKSHILTRQPNVWMKYFGVTEDEEVAEVNERIAQNLRTREEEARKKRTQEKKSVMGVVRLCSQPILKDHTPKKNGRKIVVLAKDKKVRLAAIGAFVEFCNTCAECYRQWRMGNFEVEWPPGAFKPPLPPSYNFLPSN